MQETIKSKPFRPLPKNPLDGGLSKVKFFPLKYARLEIQRLREMLPLDQNPKFLTSLDCSLTAEYNHLRLPEMTVIQIVKTNTKIQVPTESLTVIPNIFLVPTLRFWRLTNRTDQDRKYEKGNKVLNTRVEIPFEQITAFPSSDSSQPETILNDHLVVENSIFRRQL